MDWKDVGKFVAKAAPVLGGVLGGPAGAAAGAAGNLVASALGAEPEPEKVHAAIEADPEALVKIKELEFSYKERLIGWQEKQIDAEVEQMRSETERMKSVNQQMGREAKSEKWPQYTWRPYNGFLFGTCMFGVYFLLPLLDKAVPDSPYWVWVAWAGILGVAIHQKSKQKRVQAGDVDGSGGLLSKAAGMLGQAAGK